MEECPATPLILTGRNSKSPLPVGLSSPESDGMKSPSRDSPDSRCVICLGKLRNKSFTDSCLHQFCFQCLLQWSKVKAECPLCKQSFKSIIHNVRSNLDYDQYHVEHEEPRYVFSDLMHSYNFDLIPVDRRFRYRSTMTREYFRELAVSFLAHTRRLPTDDSYQINPLVPVDPEPAPSTRRSSRLLTQSQRRARLRGTSDFRRSVYSQDLWVQDLADISGRYRECSPQFYRDNPAQIHRIIPWLNREINVLLGDCESYSAYVLSRIISLLTQHPIRSREFREQVHIYFRDQTDHFIHELHTFARSVYDIAGFDQNAVYNPNPNYATEVQEISSSSSSSSTCSDSEIEVLETIKVKDRKSRKASRQGPKKLLLSRSGFNESKSDEPVAGPSGVSSSTLSQSIDICESDSEDVKILDYVKPEPELIVLSSGDDGPGYSDLDTSNGEYAEVIRSNKERRSSSPHDGSKRSKSRNGKGKCKSDGFGLKGKQKRKYLKSKKYRSSSTSSVRSSSCNSSRGSRSNSSVSSISSVSSVSRGSNNTEGSYSSNGSNISNGSYDGYGSSAVGTTSRSSRDSSRDSSSYKRSDSQSSDSSPRHSTKSKKKKSKFSRKKLKKKDSPKSSHKRHKSTSDSDRRKKKRVKSCVIVPNWSCESPTPLQRASVRPLSKPRRLKPYWSISPDNRWHEWRRSSEYKTKRRSQDGSSEDKPRKSFRDISSSPDRTVRSSINSSNTMTSTSSRTNTSYESTSRRSGSRDRTLADSLPLTTAAQNHDDSN